MHAFSAAFVGLITNYPLISLGYKNIISKPLNIYSNSLGDGR
jgi:hypothetical protein